MKEIVPGLFVGSQEDCFHAERPEWAVVHACKSPCHQWAARYKGSLPRSSPYYLTMRRGHHLYLNMIDPQQPLFMPEMFSAALSFIADEAIERKILVHCNQGLSRSASLALLHLAAGNWVDASNYEAAVKEFRSLYKSYQPGLGLSMYLADQWENLLNGRRDKP